jgi:hypothetical protein
MQLHRVVCDVQHLGLLMHPLLSLMALGCARVSNQWWILCNICCVYLTRGLVGLERTSLHSDSKQVQAAHLRTPSHPGPGRPGGFWSCNGIA